MPLYESIYIARQDISGQQVDGLTEAFGKVIEEQGGSVGKIEYWGLRNLAYRIKKNRKGHYVLMHIDAPAGAIEEMERNMRINEDIIRFMSLRFDDLEEGPSVMMQTKAAREGQRRERREPRSHEGGERAEPATEAAAPATAAPEAAPAASAPEPAPAAAAPEPAPAAAAPEPAPAATATEGEN